jgi:hypothetical protein
MKKTTTGTVKSATHTATMWQTGRLWWKRYGYDCTCGATVRTATYREIGRTEAIRRTLHWAQTHIQLHGPQKFPLVRNGNGWSELPKEEPGVQYDAYRVICTNRNCESAWSLMDGAPLEHSHIELCTKETRKGGTTTQWAGPGPTPPETAQWRGDPTPPTAKPGRS